jgi:hypothetical protein
VCALQFVESTKLHCAPSKWTYAEELVVSQLVHALVLRKHVL